MCQRKNWVIFGLAGVIAFAGMAPPATAADPLSRATPESVGVSSTQLTAFVDSLDTQIIGLHSVMVLRKGSVIAEGWWPGQSADQPHVMWSVSKSFTSAAVGLAAEENKLSLDDPVLSFFPEQAPESPSDHLRAMTVRHLLTMTCGHDREPPMNRGPGWVKRFLAHPVPRKPGTHFVYNSFGSYMLSAIVQKVTGQTVRDYLTPRLFEPLGIPAPRWDESPDGVSLGGWGLFLTTEQMARFGQLLLQRGQWDGRQLLPREYVAAATSKQVDNSDGLAGLKADWSQGYGYQFWMARHGAFRGDGLAGQFIVVLPEQDAVVLMTAQTPQMGRQLATIWDELLPAFADDPLPEDPAAASALTARLQRLGTVDGTDTAPPQGRPAQIAQ